MVEQLKQYTGTAAQLRGPLKPLPRSRQYHTEGFEEGERGPELVLVGLRGAIKNEQNCSLGQGDVYIYIQEKVAQKVNSLGPSTLSLLSVRLMTVTAKYRLPIFVD